MANGFSLAGLSIPTFWLGILAILYLAVGLGLVPGVGLRPAARRTRCGGLYYLDPARRDPRHRASPPW